MNIATRLKQYLDASGISYECIHHAPTTTTLAAAREARVAAKDVAKCVLLGDDRGYLLAILPASHRLDLNEIERQLDRRLALVDEEETKQVFADCALGAVPAMGKAYGVPTILDHRLLDLIHLYLEAGNHEDLVHLSGLAFRALLADSEFGEISRAN
jgi:Ala-tRNA(Pro) deacylase